MTMSEHHRATIDRAVARLRARDDVLGVLVGGSIAHGFATATSDVDLLIVVSDAEWERRLAAGDTTELDLESATYDGGYVDGKYTSLGFIRDVAERGTETTRFAFDGVTVAWSRVDGLEAAVRSRPRATRSTAAADRIRSFHAQLEYWQWLFREGVRSDNAFVRAVAAPNVVLFAGRPDPGPQRRPLPRPQVAAAGAPRRARPAARAHCGDRRRDRTTGNGHVDALVALVSGFRDWGVADQHWGTTFMLDTELAWLRGNPAIAEL